MRSDFNASASSLLCINIMLIFILFLFRFTKVFLDVKEKEKRWKKGTPEQGRNLMNLHNNEAGRRVSSSCN